MKLYSIVADNQQYRFEEMPRNTRFIFILFFFTIHGSFVMSQNSRDVVELNQQGDEYYQQEQFYKATEYYERAVELNEENKYSLYQLAQCYRLRFDFELARKYYGRLKLNDTVNYPLAHYYHPLMEKFNGNYDEAIKGFETFISICVSLDTSNISDKSQWIEQAVVEKEGCIFALQEQLLKTNDLNFKHLPFPVNSEFNEYAPNFFRDDSTIVFTSGRLGTDGGGMDNRYGEGFTDNFRYTKKKRKWDFLKSDDNFEITNSKWNDGAGVFNTNFDTYYFSRCGDKENTGCRIFVSKLVDGKWKSPVALNENINLPDYDTRQPSLNLQGDTLYFASNRPGGFGENDIWMSTLSTDKTWQAPINLGPKINTHHNEISPYFHDATRCLFFSSNGHQSIGGLDIFMVSNDLFDEPDVVNMGAPINSNADDCYLVFGSYYGYISSNRAGGEGKFDIYSFQLTNLNDFINDKLAISGRGWVINSKINTMYETGLYAVRDEDKLYYENIPLPEQEEFDKVMAAKLAEGELTGNTQLSEADEFYFRNLPDAIREKILKMRDEDKSSFQIFGIKDEKKQKTFQLVAKVNHLPSDPNNKTVVSGKLTSVDKASPPKNMVISLLNADNEIIKTTNTNDDGTFEFTDVDGNGPFKIVLTQLDDMSTVANKLIVEDLSVFEYDPQEVVINFENIYFDFGKYNIDTSSMALLDEMAMYLTNNPKVKVELFAFTDSVGSPTYNIQLSNKRGLAVIEYLKEKGVSGNALVVRPLGEYFENSRVNFSDSILAQFSRRVEFSINSGRKPFLPSYNTVITKISASINEFARRLNIDVNKLCQLNGLESNDVVAAFHPLTIPSNKVIKESEQIWIKQASL